MLTVAKRKQTDGEFGGRLRELREAAGYTQAELADAVGVRKQAIHRYETGLNDPTWMIVRKLAAALGCTPNDFVAGDPES